MEPWVLVDATECPGGRDQKRRGVDEFVRALRPLQSGCSSNTHEEARGLQLESLSALPNREHPFTLWETYHH